MKVIHILNEVRPSGAEMMLKLAAPYWQEMGHHLAILATGDQTGPFAQALEQIGFEIHHVPFRKSPSFFMAFGKLVREFDALHIHTERGAFEYALTARLAGVGRIGRTIHNNFQFTGRTQLLRAARRRAMALLDIKQVSIGPSVTANELERFGNKTIEIPNWYDETRFRPPTSPEREAARSQLALQPGQWGILSVGNCAPAKNHEAVIRALPLLPDAVYLHLGAELPDRNERHLALSLGVDDRVRFLGSGDPRPLLWGADAYVMPSKYEGFSIAALEAAGTGIPCVLANVPGLKDMKDVLPTIELAETTPEALATALQAARTLERLLDTSALATRFGVQRGAAAYAQLWR